jgi:hypothetical protein
MLGKRFWVIGGRYATIDFETVVDGTERLFGPFSTRGEAEYAWRDVSERHRSECLVRFSIVQENWGAAAA